MAAKRVLREVRQEVYAPMDVRIPRRLGGGVLKERVVRELPSLRVLQYALAYINPKIFSGDNGRVLGYDNAHGFSHKHLMGKISREDFPGYEALYDQFDREWKAIAMALVNEGKK